MQLTKGYFHICYVMLWNYDWWFWFAGTINIFGNFKLYLLRYSFKLFRRTVRLEAEIFNVMNKMYEAFRYAKGVDEYLGWLYENGDCACSFKMVYLIIQNIKKGKKNWVQSVEKIFSCSTAKIKKMLFLIDEETNYKYS